MKTILFADRNALVRRSVIGGNVDPDKIMPFMYTAQNKYVFPLLGTVLYEKLQNDIKNNTLTGDYQLLVDDYITDVLVQYTVVEYLPFSIYTVAQGGVLKHNPEFTIAPDRRDVDFLVQKSLQSAQFFSERLVMYLIANNPLYPEYTQSTGKSDNVFPDKGQQYNSGWVI